MVAAQQGDRRAFDELYLRFGRFVHGIVLVRIGPEDAADVVQDVFLHAWTVLDSLREPAAFGSWVAAIARRRAIDRVRQRRNIVPLETVPLELTERDVTARRDPHDALEAAEVLAAIRDLPEAYRETLALRLVEGHTGPEIAALTGLTPASVRVNLHRGFKLLRERLGIGT